jgi:uncharacterized protein (TIGR00106 family)
MSYTVNYSVIPLTHSGGHVGDIVAKVVDHIDQSGLDYRLTAMGTQVEGELDQIFDVIRECERLVEADSDRFYTVLTMDYVKDRSGNLERKVSSVEDRLGHQVHK